eukprot:1159679-Pelagomonas_calceolata.AAC.6
MHSLPPPPGTVCTLCRDAIEVDAEGRLVEGSKGIISLPEMLFNTSGVSLAHEPSGVAITFTAMDALRGWRQEDLPPLQVKVAHAWQKARLAEIQAQNAVRLEYDWTYTTPYSGTVLPSAAVAHTPVVDSLKEGSLVSLLWIPFSLGRPVDRPCM